MMSLCGGRISFTTSQKNMYKSCMLPPPPPPAKRSRYIILFHNNRKKELKIPLHKVI